MRKKNEQALTEQYTQTSLFQVKPEIKGLGLTKFKLDGAEITAELRAVTEANDAALLTPERWAEASARWLLKLVGGNIYQARQTVDRVISDHLAEMEEQAKQEAEALGSNVTVAFPSDSNNAKPSRRTKN